VTELEIKGRDWMAPFFRAEIVNERQFSSTTIQELIEEVLKIVGLGDRTVFYDNAANRQLMTKGKRAYKHPRGSLVQTIDTGIVTSGGGHVEYQDVKCKVGESWFQWLDRQLRMAGLYMWATLDGNFVVSAPNITQNPTYRITRRRGQTRNEVNVEDHAYRFDITNMHTSICVFGRSDAHQISAVAVNLWCAQAIGGTVAGTQATGTGFEPRAIFDDEIKNPRQAQWRANRAVSEEMRAGFHLSYTVAGHRLPCIQAEDQMAIIAPDTMCQLEDDELGFNSANELGFGNNFWLDEITYRRSKDNGTSTSFDCVHPLSLAYLGEVDPKEAEIQAREAAIAAFTAAASDQTSASDLARQQFTLAMQNKGTINQ
jgi:prophage tail gpP-like protein